MTLLSQRIPRYNTSSSIIGVVSFLLTVFSSVNAQIVVNDDDIAANSDAIGKVVGVVCGVLIPISIIMLCFGCCWLYGYLSTTDEKKARRRRRKRKQEKKVMEETDNSCHKNEVDNGDGTEVSIATEIIHNQSCPTTTSKVVDNTNVPV